MGHATIPGAAPRVEFGLLGALEVRVGGRPATIGSRQQRLVLLELLLRPGEAVGSDKIIDDLWGERPPRTAAKALQVHISQLRRVLEEPGTAGSQAQLLVTEPPGYALHLDGDAVDVHRFERLLEEGRTALAAGAADVAGDKLRAALALSRGPPLGDLAFEPFAQPTVARLEELHLDALETRIDADLATGATGLVGELEALVREYPLRERLRGQLMLALYRAGRQPDALETYRDARRTLVDELGIEPGPALRRLHAAILAQDDALEAPARSAPAHTRPIADDFVGRDGELEEVEAGLDRALAGSGSLTVIGGEPGVGKTRLLERVVAAATARGALVVASRCWEAGGAPPYWPWVEALRAFVDAEGIDAVRRHAGRGATDIARILPELAEVTGDLPPAPAPDAEGVRFRLFEAVGRFFANAARARPLVVVIDDLQAADTPSLLLLRFLAPRLAAMPVLAVVTYRDTEVVPGGDLATALAELGRSPATRRIAMRGLGEDDMGRFVETIAGRAPAGLARLLLTETEGNPLFAGELVRLLVAEGRLDAAAGATAWEFGVPDELREVIGRRLEGLSEDTRALLGVASVLGRELRIDALELVSGVSRAELADALEEAAKRRVAAPVPGDPAQLRFSHALIRDVAYDALRSGDRRRLHTAAGEALEVVYAPDVDSHSAELAHHFCLAAAAGGDVGRAVGHALRAGEHAARLVAFEESVRLFELALQTLGPTADAGLRCDALLALAEVTARAGDSDAAKQRYLEAAELARGAQAPERLARAAIGYGGRFLWARATTDPHLLPLLDDAIEALGERDDPLRVQVLARLAGALRPGSGRPDGDGRAGREEAVARGEEAIAIARRLGDPATLGYAMEGHLLAFWEPGNAAERVAICDELRRLASGDAERVFAARDHSLPSRWEIADATGVGAELEEVYAMAEQMRQPAQRWIVGCFRTISALTQGRLAEGEALAGETLEIGRGTQTWNAVISHQMHLVTLRRLQGRLGELEPSLTAAVREYPTYDLLRYALAYVYVATGQTARGRELLDELAADDFAGLPRGEDWLYAIALAGETCALLGDAGRAATVYDLLAPHRDLVAIGVPDGSDDAVARVLGLLAMTLGRHDDAIDQLRHGIIIDERMGARPAVARGQDALAGALRARGRPGDAAEAAALDARAAATRHELGLAA